MFTSGIMYFLGMSQFLVVFAVIIFSAPVKMQMFIYSPHTINGTLSHDPGDSKTFSFSLALPLMMLSICSALFVSTTFHLSENGTLKPDQDYSKETLLETGLWDVLFWLLVLLVHLCAILTMDTPVDIYAFAAALFLQMEYIGKICQTSDPEKPRSFVQSNLNVLGLVSGFVIAVYNIPPDGNNRYSIFFLLFLFDYFLCIGHTWDSCPKMITICHSRLLYTIATCLCLASLYTVWLDKLLFSPMSPEYSSNTS